MVVTVPPFVHVLYNVADFKPDVVGLARTSTTQLLPAFKSNIPQAFAVIEKFVGSSMNAKPQNVAFAVPALVKVKV